MKKPLLLVGVFVAVSAITTGGVIAAQYGGGQDKPKEGSSEKAAAAKPHTMTGCLEKGTDENTFRLTNVEGTGPKTVELHADAKLKLAGHVGHKVAITGTEVDPKTLKKGTTGTAGGATGTASAGTASAGDHHMRVRSMKHIAEACS